MHTHKHIYLFGSKHLCWYNAVFIFFYMSSALSSSGGFNLNIKGWGGEDVQLYRKFINSNLIVVRVPSRSLFHLWHEKICTRDLSSGQYNSCLRSKALIEASYDKLAMLHLQYQMEKHKQQQKIHIMLFFFKFKNDYSLAKMSRK